MHRHHIGIFGRVIRSIQTLSCFVFGWLLSQPFQYVNLASLPFCVCVLFFNRPFLFESMTLASKLVRCQAIEWMPHSSRPQSTPTYCCRCVASISADSLRWNIDPWTMLDLSNNRVSSRRFVTGDSSWRASCVLCSNRPNRPVHECHSTSICVEHYPRRPDRQPMSGQWIFPMNCASHPPNRPCTNRQRYRLPIQRWI